MTAPRYRLRVRTPGVPDRWVTLSGNRKSLALTNFAEAAYVASRESMEAIMRKRGGGVFGRDDLVMEEAGKSARLRSQ